MIRSLKNLIGYRIFANDGEIGKTADYYFDDERWTVRYLVVDTGSWLTGRSVLISPRSVTEVDHEGQRINLALTQDQVRRAPGIDTAMPVSRLNEIEFNRYYGWPNYWSGGYLWGPAMSPAWPASAVGYPPPNPAATTVAQPEQPAPVTPSATAAENHVRSTKEVTGYSIQASDGDLGRVEDFLIEDSDWSIQAMVVDTSPWWFGGEVAVAPSQIDGVNWGDRQVAVKLDRATIKNSPPVDMSKLTDRK